MAGKKRSGLANDRRAYGCSGHCPITPVVQPTYTLTYDGNGNTGGTPPVDGLSPYNSGSIKLLKYRFKHELLGGSCAKPITQFLST